MPNDDSVNSNLQGMDDLDFAGGTPPTGTACSLITTPKTYSWTGKANP